MLTGMADGAIQLEVLRRLQALVRRIRRKHRLAGRRIHDLLTVGIEQRLTWLDGRCGGLRATGGLRCGCRARRLVAQRARHTLRAHAAGALFID
ncbi:hypothetical protein D3C77_525240 [compost metagenome]